MAEEVTGAGRESLFHPGETIAVILEEQNITQEILAARTGVTPEYISDVISGKRNITEKFAFALEFALGEPQSFWMGLQANYDAQLLEMEAEGEDRLGDRIEESLRRAQEGFVDRVRRLWEGFTDRVRKTISRRRHR